MKICTIIGARPQFIKASAISHIINSKKKDVKFPLEEFIIHTGQHYDPDMSEIFFKQLGIPKEKYNLKVGSSAHGEQTGKMLIEIEKILDFEKPDWVLIYGDTNSTLASALAAVKLHIPIAHVEAGMRSFNRRMPEEVNRVIADHLCQLNFCSSEVAMKNLKNEGRESTAFFVGDVMYDCSLYFSDLAEKSFSNRVFARLNLKKKKYILLTCHRPENTNNKARLTQIVQAVNEIAEDIDVVYPVHPRIYKYLEKFNLRFSKRVITTPPVGYLEMLLLEKESKLILTDSGGIQKEAFFLKVPCVTMRDETEWVETVELGFNKIVGAEKDKIKTAIDSFLNDNIGLQNRKFIQPYGNGDASGKIIALLKKEFYKF